MFRRGTRVRHRVHRGNDILKSDCSGRMNGRSFLQKTLAPTWLSSTIENYDVFSVRTKHVKVIVTLSNEISATLARFGRRTREILAIRSSSDYSGEEGGSVRHRAAANDN